MPNSKTFLSLHDVLWLARDHLVPRQAMSLYRYVELVVQLALLRQYRFEKVLETGPGIFPVFSVWPRNDFGTGAIVDYNEKVLNYCNEFLAGKGVESIHLDFDHERALQTLDRKWDLIVSNGVIEHLQNDAAHVSDIYESLNDGGFVMCVTVLHERLYNDWDRAVGHYRRYSPRSLLALFERFAGVQLIQTSLIQELVRPLFFGRIRHLASQTLEENNLCFVDEAENFSRPPYASVFSLIRWLLPMYLCVDWWVSHLVGGIAVVIARK